MKGVGTRKIKGQGPITWKTTDDDGNEFDIRIENALYVPDMDYRILSVVQWGNQRADNRTDGYQDHTHIVTNADGDTSTLFVNRCKTTITITHQNRLPKIRC